MRAMVTVSVVGIRVRARVTFKVRVRVSFDKFVPSPHVHTSVVPINNGLTSDSGSNNDTHI